MTMPRNSMLALADKAFGGGLINFIRALRKQDISYEDIAKQLHDYDIDVSGRTLANWDAQYE